MTIIVFLVDTSASMQQKAYVSGRSTLLDVAKGAVEFFVKMRQKSPESRGDRYMLLTFEESPRNIKAGWKENLQTFMNELKNLEASGMTTMGSALKQVFDILNINRMQTGIDMYGQGRYPFYLEPAVIIVISDGGKLTTQGCVQLELNLPMHSSVPGSELTREPFRWDQRLYALVLRMAGTPPLSQETGHVASDDSPIDAMCEVTGGRSYAVTSQRILHQCIDSLVQKLQSGVVIHFEKVGPDPVPSLAAKEDGEDEMSMLSRSDTVPLDEIKDMDALAMKAINFNKDGLNSGGSNGSRPHTPNPILAVNNVSWHNCRRLIYVSRSAQKGFAVGFWPLPEAFWPDINAPALPQRSAHPNIKFTCTNQEPMIIDNLPFDKYELEPSPLTLYILARKQPKVCWQVFIQGSSKSSSDGNLTGFPFGYLKASTNLLTVNLFVLPYNYPVLLPLLDELFKVHRLKPTSEWRSQFHTYLRTMPAYYAGPLRRVLTRMGAGNLATSLIPETMDNCLSYSVLNYLKRLKNQAKVEYDKTLSSTPIGGKSRMGPEGIKVIAKSAFKRELLTNHLLKDKFSALKDQLTDFPGFLLGIRDSTSLKTNSFRNPFDIARKNLLDQIIRMRANYLQPSTMHTKLIDDDNRHSLPIAQMGNYQDYLKKMPVPLREIESTPVRQHMFGNPFKINKNMIMDEVVMDEVSLVGPSGNQGISIVPGVSTLRGIKRHADTPMGHPFAKRSKKGPLPRDFVYKRSPSESSSEYVDMSTTLENVVPLPSPILTPPTSPYLTEEKEPVEEPTSQTQTVLNGAVIPPLPVVAPLPPQPNIDPLIRVPEVEEVCMYSPPVLAHNDYSISSSAIINNSSTIVTDLPHFVAELPPPPMVVSSLEVNNFVLNGDQSEVEEKEILKPIPTRNVVNGNSNNLNKTCLRPPPPPPPPPPPVVKPNKEELRRVYIRNHNMRQMIYKEVKRPGKNHEKLFAMLKDLHGPPNVRKDYIKEVIVEALRFKRAALVDMLKTRMDELVTCAK